MNICKEQKELIGFFLQLGWTPATIGKHCGMSSHNSWKVVDETRHLSIKEYILLAEVAKKKVRELRNRIVEKYEFEKGAKKWN